MFFGSGGQGVIGEPASWLGGSFGSAFSFGNALLFNGANSYVIGSVNSFGDAYTNRTIAAWVKWDTKTASMHIMGRSSAINRGWGIQWNSISQKLLIPQSLNTGSGYLQSSLNPTTGVWYHLGTLWDSAGATDNDKLKLYINGVIDGSATYGGTLNIAATSLLPMRFGSLTGGTSFFDGSIDSAAMWSDTDLNHIINHYAAGLGAVPDATNLVLDCRFDESDPSATTLDQTGTNTFTLTNFNYDANDGFKLH